MCVNLQNMEETALFSGKIYTADKNFTRPPVATVATNFKSEHGISLLWLSRQFFGKALNSQIHCTVDNVCVAFLNSLKLSE